MIFLPTYTPADKNALCRAHVPFVLGFRGLLNVLAPCMDKETACRTPTCGSEDQEWSLMLPSMCNPAKAALAVKTVLQTHPGHPELGFSGNSHGWGTMDGK